MAARFLHVLESTLRTSILLLSFMAERKVACGRFFFVCFVFIYYDNTLKLEALIRFMVVLFCYGCYHEKRSLFCTLF